MIEEIAHGVIHVEQATRAITIQPGVRIQFNVAPHQVEEINNGLGTSIGIPNRVPFAVTSFDDHLEVALQGDANEFEG